jgi:hypothetical protein
MNKFARLPFNKIPPQTSVRLKVFKQDPSKVKVLPGLTIILEPGLTLIRQLVNVTDALIIKSPFT